MAAAIAGSAAWTVCSGGWSVCKRRRGGGGYRASSGNRAFDEYRAETLRRLEEEQGEFIEFLDRLRHARDKAEFDQFMADRGRRSNGQQPQPQSV
jgi:hypothetical protein